VKKAKSFADGKRIGRRAGKRDGLKAALEVVNRWRAREQEHLACALKGDVPPKANATDIADDARSREAVLRGAAADIREILTDLG
jgi:hypothetical protein